MGISPNHPSEASRRERYLISSVLSASYCCASVLKFSKVPKKSSSVACPVPLLMAIGSKTRAMGPDSAVIMLYSGAGMTENGQCGGRVIEYSKESSVYVPPFGNDCILSVEARYDEEDAYLGNNSLVMNNKKKPPMMSPMTEKARIFEAMLKNRTRWSRIRGYDSYEFHRRYLRVTLLIPRCFSINATR